MSTHQRVYRLLIIDDDEIDQRYYIELLNRQAPGGFEIVQAHRAEDGLAKLSAQTFDCVLLDFSLPGMTGLEFLSEAAADGGLPCAVVMVTGQGNETLVVNTMKSGVQDYLSKDGLTGGTLIRAITTAILQAELRERLSRSMLELKAANEALEQEVVTRKATEAELREAKALADEANAAKTRFVAMVTHELRTPLNGILGYAQLLNLEGSLSELQQQRVNAMMLAGQHLRSMIESVLDFASIEAGRFVLNPEPISVNDLADDCIAFIRPLATERMLRLLTIKSCDAPRQITADPARLRQIVLNLLGNAVKYTPSGGVDLRFMAGSTPGGLRIEIADTGPGIDEAYRSRLFQDFERSNAHTSCEGAGLGLAIAARIVRQMQGEIGYSPNPGGGSVFWLDLPAAGAISAPSPNVAAIAPSSFPLSVLLAEDVAMNRDVISAFLRTAGHRVTAAQNGREAVRFASAETFDLILMDVQMPEMDGLEATRHIRAMAGANSQVPILALTAQTFAEQVALCLDAGMNGHVAKPVDYAILNRAIAKAVSVDRHKQIEPSRTHPIPAVHEPRQQYAELDRVKFNETAGFLPPEEVQVHLEWLSSHCDQIARYLDQPETSPVILIEMTHTLASTSGMFGFTSFSGLARSYEHSLKHQAPDAHQLAQVLRREIRLVMATLETLIQECPQETRQSPIGPGQSHEIEGASRANAESVSVL
jgi:signal transduction histidine kinase